MDNNKKNKKGEIRVAPRADNDQLGENASNERNCPTPGKESKKKKYE